MSKLKLLVGIGICSVVFSGCGIFGDLFSSNKQQEKKEPKELICQPQDLTERLKSYNSVDKLVYKSGYKNVHKDYEYYFNNVFKDMNDENQCDSWLVNHYNEVVKNETKLPTTFSEEERFASKWSVCNAMPKWLESRLNEYIEQNKNDDKAYIEASKFKESWKSYLDGELVYYYITRYSSEKETKLKCRANITALKAIENDLIDLGNGKKAKCADLNYKDAPKCKSYFNSVYNATFNQLKLKQERIEYEKKNKNL